MYVCIYVCKNISVEVFSKVLLTVISILPRRGLNPISVARLGDVFEITSPS